MSRFRNRPGFLVLLLLPVPLLVTLLAMLGQLGAAEFGQLLWRPRAFMNGASNPWPALLRPLLACTALLGLFAWLTVTLPDSPVLRTRTLRIKRIVVALGALLTAATLWLGVILGDIIWHVALDARPEVEAPPSFESAPGLVLLAVLISAGALYALIRPVGRVRRRGD